MHYVQKHNICTNVPSSQTFRSYLLILQSQSLFRNDIICIHIFLICLFHKGYIYIICNDLFSEKNDKSSMELIVLRGAELIDRDHT
jgi:hypothetical protein